MKKTTKAKVKTKVKAKAKGKEAAKRTSPVGRTARAPWGKRKDGNPKKKPGRKAV